MFNLIEYVNDLYQEQREIDENFIKEYCHILERSCIFLHKNNKKLEKECIIKNKEKEYHMFNLPFKLTKFLLDEVKIII